MGSADIMELEIVWNILSSCPQMIPPGSNNLTGKKNIFNRKVIKWDA